MSKHMVVTYSAEKAETGHVDPNFTQMVYGDSGDKSNVMEKNLEEGSYVFFNARIGNQRYITAYFYVEKILIKGKHDHEIASINASAKEDRLLIIGSRYFSKVLTVPLLLNRNLMEELISFGADKDYFNKKKSEGHSELVAIKDKTLNHKLITEEEKEYLIDLCKNRG
ncbi:hypothetical protein [Halobacillus trueperi]|uniref:hypothetical protein n=1 Tax=Halobacillus trueperi TaxID=156205 RepID=UPI003736F622